MNREKRPFTREDVKVILNRQQKKYESEIDSLRKEIERLSTLTGNLRRLNELKDEQNRKAFQELEQLRRKYSKQ